ncbi:MAG: hypothetical protein AseanaTS_27910 [Candidatus Pelagadaptatus aseana]|uniref:acetyl-CoA hydrolase/transferase C-terminal domain-containing protein n=1 Tax=Candidatus Pelagadaptatus aseana TaxID=3120508 RepID=UPI0039B27FB7
MSESLSNSLETVVDQIIERCGPHVKLFIPLGLGKPAQLTNALYQRVKASPNLQLTLLTALTLERPSPGKGLQKAYLEPIFERIFGGFVGYDYMADIRKGAIPDNVTVHEFFVKSGGLINVPSVQQNYISSNYTHAARDALHMGVNCIAQVVAVQGDQRDKISFGCNPEITLNAMAQAEKLGLKRPVLVGQIHHQLPYMGNDAEVSADTFDLLLDNPDYSTRLFGAPNMPVTMNDFLIGLYASRLMKDGGTLQIGIGALGDAVAYGLKFRHEHNDQYHQLMQELQVQQRFGEVTSHWGEDDTFEQGIYGSSEMFVDGFLYLMKAGVLKKHVYPDLRLQQWANQHPEASPKGGAIALTPEAFRQWLSDGVIPSTLTAEEVSRLHTLGILNQNCQWQDSGIVVDGQTFERADLTDPALLDAICQRGLGEQLNSTFMHGGFFLGPNQFYQELRELSETEQRGINMTDIRYMNHLYDNEELKRAQRQHARFINTCFTVSLMGAATSDALENGQVVSGVGGQYNFVSQAHELDGGRSILMIKATREKNGVVSSNIVPHYGHVTIPKHLRDIYISEYGIADVRGKCDADIVKAMLNIADSRFQPELLAEAKRSGKLPDDYQIPEIHRHNTPEHLAQIWQRSNGASAFPAFPFGSEFTPLEQQLGKALKHLAAAKSSKLALFKLIWQGRDQAEAATPYMERMGLMSPAGLAQKMEAMALKGALRATGVI